MSGGSLDYISYRIEETEGTIRGRFPKDAQIQAFCDHLAKVTVALHDIEWDLSGDASLDEEARANITEIIGDGAELKYLIKEGKHIRDELVRAIRVSEELV